MSTNLNYKQVTNVARRTWDVEAYEKRAQERLKNEEAGNTSGRQKPAATAGGEGNQPAEAEEFTPAAKNAAKAHKSERAFLKARSSKVESLDAKIGEVEIINPEATATIRSKAGGEAMNKDNAVTKSGIGWHCKVCDCFLKDSHTYLDHINGRKHQRNLGYSMKVERSTKEQVASKLAALVKLKEQAKKATDFDDVEGEEESYHDIVKAKDEELKRKKEERKKERKERRKKKKEQQKAETAGLQNQEKTENDVEGDDAGDDEEEGGIDPNLAAMMGFSGFSGGKKNDEFNVTMLE